MEVRGFPFWPSIFTNKFYKQIGAFRDEPEILVPYFKM